MRDAECLVKVEMRYVGSIIARTTKPNLSIHVGTVEENLNQKFLVNKHLQVTNITQIISIGLFQLLLLEESSCSFD